MSAKKAKILTQNKKEETVEVRKETKKVDNPSPIENDCVKIEPMQKRICVVDINSKVFFIL